MLTHSTSILFLAWSHSKHLHIYEVLIPARDSAITATLVELFKHRSIVVHRDYLRRFEAPEETL